MFMAVYAAVAWARDRRLMKAAVALVFVAMFGWLTINFVRALRNNEIEGPNHALLSPYVSSVIITLALNALYFFGAYFWGRTAWGIARQRHELEQQATELATQQEANARRAVIDERLRISRELHDVVAHHISSIGVQAGGARRVMDTDPDAAKDALSVIENSSRTAVNEMRQLLGMLRAADPDRGHRRTGRQGAAGRRRPAARADRGGERRGPVGRFPPDRSAGPAARDRLGVGVPDRPGSPDERTRGTRPPAVRTSPCVISATAVELEVIDDGRPKHAPVGSRLGHVGIRERVGLLGGESEIGPRPVGGFRVRVRIPLDPQNRPLTGGIADE